MRTIIPVLGAAALLLAACHSAPPPVVQQQPRYLGPAQGIDMAIDASDALNEIRDSKLDFVARYYRSPQSRWPTLSVSEAQRLSALGVKIVAVWEWHSHDPAYFSYNSGYSDAISARNQAQAIGQPPGTAIYFAVDYNARGGDIDGPVRQYFQGVGAGLAAAGGGRPEYRVGVYGSGAVCDSMKRAGLAQYTWLTGSTNWAGTMNYEDWNIRQGGHFSVLSFDHDSNEAKNDYGGFQVATTGAPPAAAPAVAVAPAAAPAPADLPYDIAAPRDAVAPDQPQDGKPLQEGRWPTTGPTSSLGSSGASCRAAKSTRTSTCSPSMTSTRKPLSTSS
ncbi:MAG TPA: DUF1906 domain-containing protein [Stellaceae bacterium]